MIAGDSRPVERHGIVTPLGIQFIDEWSGKPVNDGLEVWIWPEGVPRRRVRARLAGAATYAAHGLPGLRDFEAGDGDDAFWSDWLSKPKRTFVVEARDTVARFLPVRVRVDLPVFGRARPSCPGLLRQDRLHGVPLFSAGTRSVPATAAIVRADLYDRSAKCPAAWAVVEARFNGLAIARGMTDRFGRLALFFAYPEPQASWTSPPATVTSPQSSPPMAPLNEQRWPIDITVRYDRTLLRNGVDARRDPLAATREVPDLCEALGQSTAQVVADAASPPVELTRITLRYGEAAVLRTANPLREERGRLLVTTSGSPD